VYIRVDKNERMDPIMSLLPNHLIMRIIREADGGRCSHKQKYGPVLQDVLTSPDVLDLQIIDGPNYDHYLDDLAAYLCDRRHQYTSDEDYMDMVRNPEDYR
jgi:hypothetical protein